MLKEEGVDHMHKPNKKAGIIENFFLTMSKALLSVFKISVWIMIYSFLLAGAFSSIMLLARLYPEEFQAVMSFVILSDIFGRIGITSIILFFPFYVIYKLIKMTRHTEEKEDN